MKRSIRFTEDGSHTFYVDQLNEPYHSNHGALQESMHVFIQQGLLTLNIPSVRILEIGFGTGLNALLTFSEALKLNLEIFYHAVEKYPLEEAEYSALNYEKLIKGAPKGLLDLIHRCPWEKAVKISDQISLHKEESDFRSMIPPSHLNLVYFDAFSPEKQPELWSGDVFASIAEHTDPGAVLVTYSSKGEVRRSLLSCGFEVEKVAGPPGKREMIRAIKR
jgi:tRNA U34 5-methylaminomethyl-2-thiouridine-forming methyltransferase MnmC